MTPVSTRRERLFADLAWSAWGTLGLSGWVRGHGDQLLDVESFVILAAALGDAEPRLRDESLDWCVRHGSLISRTRLRALLRRWDSEAVRDRWSFYAGTARTVTGTPWPLSGAGWPFVPSGKGRLLAKDNPAALTLRLRAAFGVSARAEAVAWLLVEAGQPLTAADLAVRTAYSKRNVALALRSLEVAGLVASRTERAQHRYRLRDPGQLSEVFGPVPMRAVRWGPLLPALWRLHEGLQRAEGLDERLRGIEARRLVDAVSADLLDADVDPPEVPPLGQGSAAVSSWLEQQLEGLAAPDEPVKSGPHVRLDHDGG